MCVRNRLCSIAQGLFLAVSCVPFTSCSDVDGTLSLISPEDRKQYDLTTIAERRAICGINSVYLFLTLHGIQVDYDDVERRIGISPSGASLLELRDACRHFGQPSTVLRCETSRLNELTLPVVVHGPTATVEGGNRPDIGHFVVVLRVDEGQVTFVDGTTGTVESIRMEFFDRNYSTGAVLEKDSHPTLRWEITIAVLLSLATVGAFRGSSSLTMREP